MSVGVISYHTAWSQVDWLALSGLSERELRFHGDDQANQCRRWKAPVSPLLQSILYAYWPSLLYLETWRIWLNK